MPMTALNRKLLREVSRLKGQIATIALVLAGGITCFIALRGTFQSLEWSREAYYDRYRFAHVFARLERAPESLVRRIEKLPGVALVQTRVVDEVSLPIEGMSRAAYAELLSLPASGQPATNALSLRSGRLPEYGRDDEVVVVESFAAVHGLRPGDRLPAVINGKLRKLRVAGTALSPEFVYTIRPGALADDPKRYAVLWMERTALASALDLGGAFNEVTLRLQPGASEAETLALLDRILLPFGGNGAIGRKNQISNRILTGELSQLGILAGIIPGVFLGVAAFLINMVLARLVTLQRTEIAALKAIGYSNVEVARHYLGLVVVVLIPGGILGILGGWALGRSLIRLYGSIFRFEDLTFRLAPGLIISSLSISACAAVFGALFAVRAAAKLPPAEAMRPPAPARYRRGVFARLGFSAVAGPSGMMVLREIERRPLRTLLSSMGIACALGLIIFGHCGIDALNYYLESTFRREQRQDLAVAFARPSGQRAIGELDHVRGVVAAEGLRAISIRVRHEHRFRDSVLMAIPDEATLRRLVEHGGREVDLPENGVLVTTALGEILGLRVGDRPELEVLEGKRPTVRPIVAGFVDESVGLQIYSRTGVASALVQDLGAVSSVLLRIDPTERPAIEDRLRRYPNVVDVSDVVADIERLRDMNGQAMDIWTFVSVSLSSLIVFGVVYNNARIALATRARELASLRVLGLSRREISSILIGGLMIEVALAIPMGLTFGWGLAEFFFTRGTDQETFRFEVAIEWKTYALAVVVTLLAALVSAFWVRRNVDALDLIGVLKTRE